MHTPLPALLWRKTERERARVRMLSTTCGIDRLFLRPSPISISICSRLYNFALWIFSHIWQLLLVFLLLFSPFIWSIYAATWIKIELIFACLHSTYHSILYSLINLFPSYSNFYMLGCFSKLRLASATSPSYTEIKRYCNKDIS